MTATVTEPPILTLLVLADDWSAAEATGASIAAQTDPRAEVLLCFATNEEFERQGGLAWEPNGPVRMVEAADRSWAGRLEACLQHVTGQNVALIHGGDTVDPTFVEVMSRAVQPGRWLYTDEAMQYDDGAGLKMWLKPDFSPELLRSCPYAVRSAVLPTELVRSVGGVLVEAGSAAWYDLVLKVAEVGLAPVHVAGPYYLRAPHADPPPPPWIDELAPDRFEVVHNHCLRLGLDVDKVTDVVVSGRPIGQRVHRRVSDPPRVSLVIPTVGAATPTHGVRRVHVVELVTELWRSARRYPGLEIVVVYDSPQTPQWVLDDIRAATDSTAVLLPYAEPFNFSRKCNLGALAASGDLLCFLNDDVSPVTEDWLMEMVGLIQDPEVGMVGAKLLFADGSIQHAGHRYDGLPSHTALMEGAASLADGGLAQLTSERSGVTAACALMRKSDFLNVGGFSNSLPLNYNDVDLCLKVRATGARIVYTPHAVLEHYESQSRNAARTEYEAQMIRRRWAFDLDHDPYVNLLQRQNSS